MSFNIKEIWLGLPGYEFYHKPLVDPDEKRWVGRTVIEEKLKSYLNDGKESGAYLITGYRGMGKTSFVRRVVNKLKQEREKEGNGKPRIQECSISFGQRDIRELDILRQIIKSLKNGILPPLIMFIHEKFFRLKSLPIWVLIGIFSFSTVCMFLDIKRMYFINIINSVNPLEVFGVYLAFSVLLGFALQVFSIWLFQHYFPIVKQYDLLEDLYDRSISQITKEAGATGTGEKFPFGFTDKLVKKFPVANPKEVENEIIIILNEIRKQKNKFLKKQFIFIFDEIDKIDPAPDRENYYHEELDKFEKREHVNEIYEYRERKRAVINILANLKYLITTADAKFIFIAGREMFDAALADIADRQSYVSSIFHQVINVESFLKDSVLPEDEERTTGVFSIIEEYLERLLLPKSVEFEGDNCSYPFLKRYYTFLGSLKGDGTTELSQEAKLKVLYTLQNLIVFLTYRSNGSPKKVARLIENLIRYDKEYLDTDLSYFEEREKKLVILTQSVDAEHFKFFLQIDTLNQYRFNLLSYLYRPFLINYSNNNKTVSDRLLVSTPYLMDHIMKFHPFAFSLKNLEMVPEVLSETRSPELRNFIEELVAYLSHNHLRETEISLFDYKFLNKTYHEINYLCKFFEEESAAFNFTLDETYHVKSMVNTRIKELRSIYKEFITKQDNEYVHSLTYLNDILGDTHFNDQEYADAITSYSDALQNLEKINVGEFNVEHYILYLRIKLKLCLTFGKIKSFEQAAGGYVQIIFKSNQFIRNWKKFDIGEDEPADILKGVSSKTDFLRLVIQPYVGELYLQEKISDEGVTGEKIVKTFQNFERLIRSVNDDKIHNHTMHGFYSSVGVLIYYKNLPGVRSGSLKEINQQGYIYSCDEFYYIVGNHNRNNDYRVSPANYFFYKESFRYLLKTANFKAQEDNLIDLLRLAEDIIYTDLAANLVKHPKRSSDDFISRVNSEKNFLQSMATIMGKLGDALLTGLSYDSESDTKKRITLDHDKCLNHKCFSDLDENSENGEYWSFKDTLFEFYDENYQSKSCKKDHEKYQIQLIMAIYFLSFQFYMRAGRNQPSSFQLRKILDISTKFLCPVTLTYFEDLFERWFMTQLLKIASWNSSASDRFQIYKIKHYVGQDDFYQDKTFSQFNYINASNSPEVKESVLLFINYNLQRNKYNGTLPDFKNLLSPYGTITTQFIRLRELNLQVQLNYKRICAQGSPFQDLLSNFWLNGNTGKWYTYKEAHKHLDKKQYLETNIGVELKRKIEESKIASKDIREAIEIVVESIGCLSEIISIINRYGINFMMNHSSLADNHKRAGVWMIYFEFFKFLKKNIIHDKYFTSGSIKKEDDIDITLTLKKKLGGDVYISRDAISHFQLALQNYNRALLMNNEGKVYKSLITNMFYLEDDFSDSLYHYCIALERQKINSGKIRADITWIKKQLNTSQVYDINSYL